MYTNSCWQYFYTGLALAIFAGWWFVWSLHILSIVYGRIRLYRASHKKFDDYTINNIQHNGTYQSVNGFAKSDSTSPGNYASNATTVVQIDSEIGTEPHNPSSPHDGSMQIATSCQERCDFPSGGAVIVTLVTPTLTGPPVSVVTARHPHHHSRSFSVGCGGGRKTLDVAAPTQAPQRHVLNHYRSLSGGSSVRTLAGVYPSPSPPGSPSSGASARALGVVVVDVGGKERATLPGVTVIKPLMGVDPNLYHNLETFFTLDYPTFEICFCVQDYKDPCIMLVKRLMDKYSKVDATLYLGGPEIVINSKINNMLPAYNSAKYGLILISDAGIKMLPNSLTDMVNTMTSTVGLVHQMPFTTDRGGFSGTLEKVYFGTAHARIYLVSDLLRINCCTGMSSLMRKSVLDAKGGLAAFGCYLAEDYFFAQAFRDMGWRHRISTQPAMQNAGDPCVKSFHERIIRWTKLRFAMVPVTIFFEPLSECLLLGLITSWAVYWLFEWNSLVFFMVHSLVWFLLDFTLLRIVQHGKLPFNRLDYLIAWIYRELSALPLFLIALNTSVLRWKNKTYRLRWGGYVEKSTSNDSLLY